jgi:hypothetical protein
MRIRPVTNALPQQRPSRRRWLRLALGLFLVIVPFVAYYEFDKLRAERAWQEACAEADRLDPGWRWDDLMAARPIPADSRTAAARVHEFARTIPQRQSGLQLYPDWESVVRPEDIPPIAVPDPEPHLDEDELADYRRRISEFRRRKYAETLQKSFAELQPERQLRPEQVAALRAVLATAAEALPLADGLEALPPGRMRTDTTSPIMFRSSLAHTNDSRAVGLWLRLRAILAAQDGRPDEALGDCHRILVAASVADTEPSAIAGICRFSLRVYGVGAVERVLAQGEPSPHSLVKLQQALETESTNLVLVNLFRGERAMFEDFVRCVEAGCFSRDEADRYCAGPRFSVTNNQTIDGWLNRLRGGTWTKWRAAVHLQYLTLLVETAKRLPNDLLRQSAEVAAAEARNASQGVPGLMIDVTKVASYDRRSQALVSSAAAALATERFRREAGRWPHSLTELVPTYLTVAPTDPFDGQPLRYRRWADGLVIYSIGANGIDDGGQVSPTTEPLGSPDVGVRLWDVAKRRQPPPAVLVAPHH